MQRMHQRRCIRHAVIQSLPRVKFDPAGGRPLYVARDISAAARSALISPRMSGRREDEALWRRRLSGELAVLIAVKFAALALLWWLFFSPPHRTPVDAEAASHRLGVTEVRTIDLPRAAPPPAPGASGG